MSEPLTPSEINNLTSTALKGWETADEQLQDLLELIFGRDGQHTENSVGLTVLTGGTMISGIAVPYTAWHKIFADFLKELSPEISSAMERLKTAGDEVHATRQATRDANDLITPPMYYLHFKESFVIADGGRTPVKSGPWRVTLDKVDAWFLGSHTPAI